MKQHYSESRTSNGLVFVSGQLAFNADRSAAEGDVQAQTRACLGAIERILEAQGLSRRSIVRCTCWLSSPLDYSAFNEAYASFFFGITAPARTTIAVALCLPGARVEIDAIAARDTSDCAAT